LAHWVYFTPLGVFVKRKKGEQHPCLPQESKSSKNTEITLFWGLLWVSDKSLENIAGKV